MIIEYKDIKDIKTNPENAKLHTEEQIEKIKSSILEFGFNDPLGVDANYQIIEGHGRLIALKELNYEKVPVIVLDNLTEEQKTAYGLVHNKLTNNTGFDNEILQEELEGIEAFDMSKYSFWTKENEFFENEIQEEKPKELKGIIVANAEPGQVKGLRAFLDEHDIEYEEK